MRTPDIKCVCPECGRIWTKRLSDSVDTLDRDTLRRLKNGSCYDCHERRMELLNAKIEKENNND